MIPVKWYIVVMLGAGIATFLYGVFTGHVPTILGSFLFFGIGGLAYFATRKKHY
jgi:CHASE2 domain-containing sensor protein